MAITKQLAQPPEPPQRSDPATFSTKADAFVAWLVQFASDLSVWIEQANSTEQNVKTLEENTKTFRDQVEALRDEALVALNAAIYDQDATYNYPDTVIGEDGHTYRCLGTNVTGDNPVGSTTGNWKRITAEFEQDLYVESLDIVNVIYEDGKISEIDYSGGFKTTFTYDSDKLTNAKYYSSDGETVLLEIQINYDGEGNIISVTRV